MCAPICGMIGPITFRQTCTETTSRLCVNSTSFDASCHATTLCSSLCIIAYLNAAGESNVPHQGSEERRAMGAHRRYGDRKFAFGNQLLTFRTRASLTQSALAE